MTVVVFEDHSPFIFGCDCMLIKCKETKTKNSLHWWWLLCVASGFCLAVTVKAAVGNF